MIQLLTVIIFVAVFDRIYTPYLRILFVNTTRGTSFISVHFKIPRSSACSCSAHIWIKDMDLWHDVDSKEERQRFVFLFLRLICQLYLTSFINSSVIKERRSLSRLTFSHDKIGMYHLNKSIQTLLTEIDANNYLLFICRYTQYYGIISSIRRDKSVVAIILSVVPSFCNFYVLFQPVCEMDCSCFI